MNNNYRTRIYNSYVNSRQGNLAPTNLEGLKPRAPYLRRLIRSHFPHNRDASVLDLGCGHGSLIYFLKQAGYYNVRGVDVSPEQVIAARRLGINSIEQGDLVKAVAAIPDASLDCIVAFDVIEHFTKDELVELIDEVSRGLTADGCLIIHVPNGESPFCGRILYSDFTHELAFTHQSISQLLLSSGFSSVESFEDEPVIHGLKSALRWILWKAIRNVLRLYIAVETGNMSPQIFSQNFLVIAKKTLEEGPNTAHVAPSSFQ